MTVYVCCTTREFLLACTASCWAGEPGRCRWCDAELAGRRTVWCSDRCSFDFQANHYWSAASSRRKRTDGYVCLECGVRPEEAWRSMLVERPSLARHALKMEVHHVVPILGRHAENGCHHHQDGLRTLCGFHHLEAHRVLRLEAA